MIQGPQNLVQLVSPPVFHWGKGSKVLQPESTSIPLEPFTSGNESEISFAA